MSAVGKIISFTIRNFVAAEGSLLIILELDPADIITTFIANKIEENPYLRLNGRILVNLPSIQHRNSSWKIRRDFIGFERRIYVEIMTSI